MAGLAVNRAASLVLLLALAGCTSAAVTTTPASPVTPVSSAASTQPPSARPFSSPASHTATASPAATAGAALHAITDEGQVTYNVTLHAGQCHARDSGRLPDPACTPGSYDPKVTQASIRSTICMKGWTATVRPPASQTDLAKFNVAYPAYSIPAGTVSELDHLIPLELGGSNDITNLWPEVGKIPNAKDPVENDLKADVCAGEMTLAAARAAIARDWLTVP